ncbi:hypothetical protein KC220_22515, partial [Mycobacterium tuberculosis]|nr:hypothetical protein [Mycobacterium tuberculosis]
KNTEEVRHQAALKHLDRRRCSDGLTRVKLPGDMMESYIIALILDRNAHDTPGERGAPKTPLDQIADLLSERLRRIA